MPAPATNPPAAPALPSTGWIRRHVLLRSGVLPFAATSLDERVKAGSFPAPKKFGPRTTAFDAEAVHRWIAAQRDGGAA